MIDPPARMWLSLDFEGRRHQLEIPGPGGTVRFALGTPGGPQSGTWRLWANRSKPDVYLAARSIAGWQKYSFHASGDWRHQWTSCEKAAQNTGVPDRIMDQWPRVGEIAAGLTQALTIWIPTSELTQPRSPAKAAKETIWVPAPELDVIVGFRVAVWQPDRGVMDASTTRPIDGFSLSDGTAAFVFVSQEPLTPEKRIQLDEMKRQGLQAAKLEMTQALQAGNLRLSAHGRDEAGNRHVWDLAVGESDLRAHLKG